jgi:hypothetical protein
MCGAGERVYDISFWKSELNSEINAMATEIENLKVKIKERKKKKERRLI